MQELAGADVRFGDVTDMESLRRVAFADPVDVVVSCLASRTGGLVALALWEADVFGDTYRLARRAT